MQTDETRAREAALACANEACRNMDGELDLDAMTRHFLAFAAPPAVEREMPADDEIRLLREALTIYGDRVRMATSCRPDLQQVIDYAFEHVQDRPAFGGDSETRPTLHPSDREEGKEGNVRERVTHLLLDYKWSPKSSGEIKAEHETDECSGALWDKAFAVAEAILALSGSLAPANPTEKGEL